MSDSKLTFLKNCLQQRETEIYDYQLNIDNFTRAIEKLDTEHRDNSDSSDFKQQLLTLLADNKREQFKSIIMRDVLAEQIAELEES